MRLDFIGVTPTKSLRNCCVCGENKPEIRNIGSDKERKLSELLLKYGGIHLVEGILCRGCHERLLNIDKNVSKFRDQCLSTKSKSKRCFREPLEEIGNKLSKTSELFQENSTDDSGILTFNGDDHSFSLLSTPQLLLQSTPVSSWKKNSRKTLNFTDNSYLKQDRSRDQDSGGQKSIEKEGKVETVNTRSELQQHTDHAYVKPQQTKCQPTQRKTIRRKEDKCKDGQKRELEMKMKSLLNDINTGKCPSTKLTKGHVRKISDALYYEDGRI